MVISEAEPALQAAPILTWGNGLSKIYAEIEKISEKIQARPKAEVQITGVTFIGWS